MNYIAISEPASRDDQCDKIIAVADEIFKHQFTFGQAPTASGKTRNMTAISEYWIEKKGTHSIIFSLAHNESVASQHVGEFERAGFNVFTNINPKTKRIWTSGTLCKEIEKIHATGGCVVIVLFSIGHNLGAPLPAAELLSNSLDLCAKNSIQILVHIDELHLQLTKLTGGINSTFYHDKVKIENHIKVINTPELNVFDWLRSVNATTIGWSATLNNLIASKTYSLGYAENEMCVLNIAPISGIYSMREFCVFNPDSAEDYIQMMIAEESRGGKTLCIFANTKELDKFKRTYYNWCKVPISATEITHRTSFKEGELAANLCGNQYVLGVDIVATGFDLASYIGENFNAIFLFREFSDRGSMPLSSNKHNPLYCKISAALAQAAGRARDSECHIYTSLPQMGINLLSIYQNFYELTEKAVEEACVYGPPAPSQEEREYAGIYVALCQNITSESPTSEKILTYLYRATGRYIDKEIGPKCDHLFWRKAVANLWAILSENTNEILVLHKIEEENARTAKQAAWKAMIKKVKEAAAIKREAEAKEAEERARARKDEKSGGCEGQVRIKPTGLLADLLEISGNRCGHCGIEFNDSREPEISHILPHALGGEASINNCLPAHKSCNGAHDTCEQLLDMDDEHYWILKGSAYSGKPLKISINKIRDDNIAANWKRAQDYLKIPESIRAKNISIREWLRENGFEQRVY